MKWFDVCSAEDLVPERGACVLVAGRQVALFLIDGELFAVDNRDPFSEANVIARGIVGSKGDIPKVASPMYKQTFDLRTGRCLDDASVTLRTYEVRAVSGRVEVGVA